MALVVWGSVAETEAVGRTTAALSAMVTATRRRSMEVPLRLFVTLRGYPSPVMLLCLSSRLFSS